MKNLRVMSFSPLVGRVKNILVTLLFALASSYSNAQVKPLKEVEVNLGSGTFVGTEGLPFDVPFRIKSKIGKEYQEVSMRYRIKPSEHKNWMHFPSHTDDNGWSNLVKWNNLGEEFYLPCGPLHPNVIYEFKFDVVKKTSLDDAQKKELKKTVFNIVTSYINNIRETHPKDLEELNENLDKAIQMAVGPGGRVKEPDMKTDFSFDIGDDDIDAFLDAAITVKQTIDRAEENIKNDKRTYLKSNSDFADLRDSLLHIDEKKLDNKSTQLWDAPINTNATDYKTLKMSELAAVIKNPTSDFSKVIGGTLKIDKNGLIVTEQPSIASMEILRDFFYALDIISDNTGKKIFPRKKLDVITTSLTDMIENHVQLKQAKDEKKTLIEKVPDLLQDKYVQFSYIVYDQSTSDVVSQSNPYIGLDFGFVVLPSYEQVFFYDGVNFYFSPVNKDAPLSSFNGNFWNSLSKRISVHLGLTQSLVTANNKRYEPLIKDAGSLLIGAGFRFSRVCRINYGVLTFWEKNTNPLIDKRELRHMGAISFTIDFNVAKALGNVGKGLGLKS